MFSLCLNDSRNYCPRVDVLLALISGLPTFAQLRSTVTRELRSDAAGSELVERLIAAAGGVAGLVPSGIESIPV